MTSLDSAFARALYKRVADTHKEISTRILTRGAIKSIDEYNADLSKLDMLDLVISMIAEEHQRLLNPEERS